MKVWISKYALSGGITEHEARISEGYAFPGAPFASFVGFRLGKDAHETQEAAVVAAMNMRNKKIKSLKQQIAKLEQTTF
jgi:hypothetical protein